MYPVMSEVGQNIFLTILACKFMNEMDLNVDVFTPFMKLRIFNQLNNTLIIKKYNGSDSLWVIQGIK